MKAEDIIRQSAALRRERKFDEAIDLIKSNIAAMDEDIKVNAWLEAFYAAKEKAEQGRFQAEEYARLIAMTDPDCPSIQSYL